MIFRKKDGNLCEKNILSYHSDTQYYKEIKAIFDLIHNSNYQNPGQCHETLMCPKYNESLRSIENALNKVGVTTEVNISQ